MHPAKEGFSALPFFDEFDLSTVDVLLISQYVHLLFFLSKKCYTRDYGKRTLRRARHDCRNCFEQHTPLLQP